MKEQGERDSFQNKIGEDFLEGSFELNVEIRVSFLKAEAEVGRWSKDKGIPCRGTRMENNEGMIFEGLSPLQDSHFFL